MRQSVAPPPPRRFERGRVAWHDKRLAAQRPLIPEMPSSPAGVALDFRRKLFAMLGLCFVLVMVALDQTVIGTALPTIMAELHGFELYAWVGTVYLLASIVTVPVFGKLGDDHGRRLFILWAIALFTLASVLCGLAQSMVQLVCARALQGVGGGMLIATTFASVPDLFPDPRERLRWQVLFSTAFGLANAVGPTLGGVLTEYLGWRSVFFVNLPVGVISLWFVWRYLPDIRHRSGPTAPLDWAGALLLALTLGSVLLLVEWLPQGGSAWILAGLAALACAAGAALLWWERRCPDPVLPLALFADRGLQSLFTLSLVIGFCLFAVVYYAPLLLQGGLGLSPKEAGLRSRRWRFSSPSAASSTVVSSPGCVCRTSCFTSVSVFRRRRARADPGQGRYAACADLRRDDVRRARARPAVAQSDPVRAVQCAARADRRDHRHDAIDAHVRRHAGHGTDRHAAGAWLRTPGT